MPVETANLNNDLDKEDNIEKNKETPEYTTKAKVNAVNHNRNSTTNTADKENKLSDAVKGRSSIPRNFFAKIVLACKVT